MRNLLFLIVLLCFLFQLFIVGRFPLPSNPEVELSSAAYYLADKGVENLFAADFNESFRLTFVQNPLTVLLNAALLEKYPADIFTMRVVNTVFCFFTLLLLFRFFTKMERGSFKNASILITAALLLDPILNSRPQSSMSEWLGVFFLLVSLKKEFDKDGHTFRSTISSAFFCALAFYSSFSLLFLLPAIFLYKLFKAIVEARENQYNSAYHLATWPFLLALFYFPWFFSTMDLNTFYVSQLKPDGFYLIPLAEHVLCAGAIILLIYTLTLKYKYHHTPIIWLCVALIVNFHVLSYFITISPTLIVPFYYLFVFALLPLNVTSNQARELRYYPLAFLAIVHGLIFSVQLVVMLKNYQNRSGSELVEFVGKTTSPKRHVTGDATVFYGIAENNRPFRLVANEQKLKSYFTAQDMDYLLLSQHFIKNLKDTSVFALHSENIQKLGTFSYSPVPIGISEMLGLADPKEEELYSCVLFRYKRE